ncbi:MAG: GntR family transcriptional regulator [Clostridia bacterium]|nr:GntR family transcriptional regulator [Clostridia bacterium]
MTIIINNKSGIPIYEQIYTQIKNAIINDSFKEDDPLPSIRSLAKDLRISVITTKRAYDELEKDGFIYTVAGKGCFVAAKNVELLRENNLKLIEDHLSESIQLARSCNLSVDDLKQMIDVLSEEGNYE